MKTKIEFTVVENIEKQIKDWKMSDEQIEKYSIKRDEIYKHYIKKLEDVIRKEIDLLTIQLLKISRLQRWKNEK